MKKTTTADQIKNLKKMKSAALREQFHKVTGKEAASNDRALLIKAISGALNKTAPAKDEAATKPEASAEPKPAAKAKDAKPSTANKDGAALMKPAPTPDPRMPAVGTVIQKRDRHGAVRCECTVEADGIRYKRELYKSLSAAAIAAAKDLGLGDGALNGWTFWGITKPARRESDPLLALDRAWERYRGNVETLVKTGITDDNRTKVAAAIKKHASTIEALREKVA